MNPPGDANDLDKRKIDLAELIVEKREQILEVAAKRGAGDVRIFGSVARGDYTSESDKRLVIEK